MKKLFTNCHLQSDLHLNDCLLAEEYQTKAFLILIYYYYCNYLAGIIINFVMLANFEDFIVEVTNYSIKMVDHHYYWCQFNYFIYLKFDLIKYNFGLLMIVMLQWNGFSHGEGKIGSIVREYRSSSS